MLHRNPHYRLKDSTGKALPYQDAVTLSFYDAKASGFLMFLQGHRHFVNGLGGSFKGQVFTKTGQLKPDFATCYNLSKSV